MDNLIQKFYSNGKEEEQKYTQFGAFSNSLLKNSGTKFNFIKPNISVVNPAIHNVETKTQISIPKTPNKDIISNNTYLNPKKLIVVIYLIKIFQKIILHIVQKIIMI